MVGRRFEIKIEVKEGGEDLKGFERSLELFSRRNYEVGGEEEGELLHGIFSLIAAFVNERVLERRRTIEKRNGVEIDVMLAELCQSVAGRVIKREFLNRPPAPANPERIFVILSSSMG